MPVVLEVHGVLEVLVLEVLEVLVLEVLVLKVLRVLPVRGVPGVPLRRLRKWARKPLAAADADAAALRPPRWRPGSIARTGIFPTQAP